MNVRRMHIAFWIPKAIDTQSEYVIINCFSTATMVTRTLLDVAFIRRLRVLLKIQDLRDMTPCHYGPTWEERDAAFFIGSGACVCVWIFFRYDWKVLTDLSASAALLMGSTHQQC
jgi:hypothetical protein